MAHPRSLVVKLPAVLGLALALALVSALWLGGGTALASPNADRHAAGTTAPKAPAGVTFQPLTLVNGWASAQAPFRPTGDPSVGFSNGVVYLSGSLYQASGTNNLFATLPSAYWPGRELSMPVYTANDTEGSLIIHPDGIMILSGGNVTGFTSLAGVSFPLTLTTTKLTLINGWTSGGYPNGDPGISASGGVAYLSGSLSQLAGTNNTFATLPTAYWPSRWLYLPIYTTDGNTALEASLSISPQGQLSVFGNISTRNFSSLAGISYPLTLTTQSLTLLNGWQSEQSVYDTGDPAVAVSNGVVYLSGSARRSSGSQSILAQLPAAYRPSHWLFLPAYTLNGTEGSLNISPQGNVYALGTNAAGYISLAGIHYPLGS